MCVRPQYGITFEDLLSRIGNKFKILKQQYII